MLKSSFVKHEFLSTIIAKVFYFEIFCQCKIYQIDNVYDYIFNGAKSVARFETSIFDDSLIQKILGMKHQHVA